MDYYIKSKTVRTQLNKVILLLNSTPEIKLTGEYLLQVLTNLTAEEVYIPYEPQTKTKQEWENNT